MEQILSDALRSPADFSTGFTQRMEELRSSVEHDVGAPVLLDEDMNYASSQKLSLFLDREERPRSERDDECLTEIAFLVSSRGPLFAVVELWRGPENEWKVRRNVRPSGLAAEIVSYLVSHGFTRVPSPYLEQPAEGHFTLMDGAPANVFEVLFSELY